VDKSEELKNQIPISKELKKRIKIYRKRFNIKADIPDSEVIRLIKDFRWLAKLYIQEFKDKDPKKVLRDLEVGYNKDADNQPNK
jgi:hypothetical protein